MIKTLDDAQCEALLSEVKNGIGTYTARRKGVRNYLMALLMLDAGLRVGEVVQLRISDLLFGDEPTEALIVSKHIAKRGRERRVPLTSRIRDAIQTMNEEEWHYIPEYIEFFAFYILDMKKPLTTRHVQRIIGEAGIRARMADIHPHILRHTFASRLMRTTSIRIVQQLLGHVNLSSTQVYTHPNSQDLTAAIASIDKTVNFTGNRTGI